MVLIENDYVTVEVPAYVTRAIDVADVAKKQLLIVSTDPVFNKIEGATVVTPCPCGFFGHDIIKCRCQLVQIEKHQFAIRETYREGYIRIDGLFCSRNIKYKQLDETCLLLLKHAISELSLSIYQLLLITDVAGAIAKMDGTKTVRSEHIAEALAYRTI
ncbi:hypothetical protein LCGC14_0475530 [marine sediment metagenome]|uniref:Mg chelatase-related protein C-terminal domain-containing protein n=1 Tax=marine sediment metagenome TaxID=412755 RepID=A0A0F9SB04_9ZZZZ